MTRADRILIIIIMSALPVLYTRMWAGNTDAGYLQIQAGSKAPITEELSPDRTLHIHGPLGDSVIAVNNGRARFISSPCRGQVCVQTGWLQTSGDFAACLPNRISLTLLGQHPRFDAINF
jgi:hypothetical protein